MSFEDMGIVRGLAHSVVLEVTDAVMFMNILLQLMDAGRFYWLRTIRKQARVSMRGLYLYHWQEATYCAGR